MYALLCGYLPFEDKNTKILYRKILSGDYKLPKFIRPYAKDLMRKILNIKPDKRYTIDQIRAHKWYKKCGVEKE